MKLRIKDNSLRLRLTQSEVKAFTNTGSVVASITFGHLPENKLVYAIVQKKDVSTIQAIYESSKIELQIPEKIAQKWATTEQIGMETVVDIGNGQQLKLLIEKDFQCLKVRKNGEDEDAFPHPLL